MPRFAISLSAFVVVAALAGGTAFAQTTVEKKMKNTEEPSSPAMQQAAAKQAECKKQAKTKKLTGSERKAFMADCTK
jgi:hypothetical protein